MPGDSVSGDSVSGDSVSGDSVSGDSVSGNLDPPVPRGCGRCAGHFDPRQATALRYWDPPVDTLFVGSEKGLTVGGSVALGVGTVTAALFGHAHSVCNSGLGVLAQGVSSSAAQTCANDDLVFYLGVGAVVVGAVLLIAGLTSRNRVTPLPDEAQESAPTVPLAVESKSRKAWLWGIAPVVLLIIVGAVVSGGKASTASTGEQSPTVTSGNTGNSGTGTGNSGNTGSGNTGTGNTGNNPVSPTTTAPPVLTPTPNLVGMTVDQAESTGDASGAFVSSTGATWCADAANDYGADGNADPIVTSQSPAAGTMESSPSYGTTMDITVRGSCPS